MWKFYLVRSFAALVVITVLVMPSLALDFPLRGEDGELILGLGEIEDAEFSPDGTHLATGGSMGVFVWNFHTGELVHWLKYERRVVDIAFSPDGTQLLAGEISQSLSVWNVADGVKVKQFSIGEDFEENSIIESVAFAENGLAAIGMQSGQIYLYDTETDEHNILDAYDEGVSALQFFDNGERLISQFYDLGTIWNVETLQAEKNFTDLAYYHSIAVSPEEQYLITLSLNQNPYTNVISIYDAENYALLNEFDPKEKFSVFEERVHRRGLSGPIFSLRDKDLILIDSFVLDIENFTVEKELNVDFYLLNDNYLLHDSGDNFYTLGMSPNYVLSVYDSETNSTIFSVSDYYDRIYEAKFSPDGDQVLTGSKVWSMETGHVEALLVEDGDNVDFSEDGSIALTVYATAANIWDASSWSLIKNVPLTYNDDQLFITDAFLVNSGTQILCSYNYQNDPHAGLLDIEAEELIYNQPIQVHIYGKIIAISPKHTYFVTFHEDAYYVYKTEDGILYQTLADETYTRSIAFSADEKHLMIENRLWNIDTGNLHNIYEDLNANMFDGLFFLEQQNFWVGLDWGTNWPLYYGKAFNVQSGEEHYLFNQQPFPLSWQNADEISFLDISPDGEHVLTSADYHSMRVWDMPEFLSTSIKNWGLY